MAPEVTLYNDNVVMLTPNASYATDFCIQLSDNVVVDSFSTSLQPKFRINVTSTGNNNNCFNSAVYYVSSWVWVTYVVIGSVGIFCNATVAIVLLYFTNMRHRLTNIYVINQSLIDLVTSLFLLLTTLFQDQSLPSGLAGDLKCLMWLSKDKTIKRYSSVGQACTTMNQQPFWASLLSSSMNLIAITLERYLKIVHPVSHHISFTKKRAIVSLVVIWAFGFLYTTLKLVPTSAVYQGRCLTLAFWPSLAAKRIDAVINFLLRYLLPIAVFVFCYSRMAIALKRGNSSKRGVRRQHASCSNHTTRKGATSLVRTMIVVSVAFVSCLSLNQWLFLFYNTGLLNFNLFATTIHKIGVIGMYLNCCVNPIIYVFTFQQFREAVGQLCRLRLPKVNNGLLPDSLMTRLSVPRSREAGGGDEEKEIASSMTSAVSKRCRTVGNSRKGVQAQQQKGIPPYTVGRITENFSTFRTQTALIPRDPTT